jgi:uncharacterized DUF497 family protein
MEDDDFEWDDIKDWQTCVSTRSFYDARWLFDDFILIEQDLSDNYDEEPCIAIGMVRFLLTVVYVERGTRPHHLGPEGQYQWTKRIRSWQGDFLTEPRFRSFLTVRPVPFPLSIRRIGRIAHDDR